VAHLDFVEHGLGPLLDVRGGEAFAVRQREADVLFDGQLADQVERLKDEADLFVADPGALVAAEGADVLTVEDVLPSGGRVEQAEDRQQGGLAATRGTGDADIFARLDLEAELVQCARLHLLGEKGLLQTIQLDQRL
jgi:hypothetical protein